MSASRMHFAHARARSLGFVNALVVPLLWASVAVAQRPLGVDVSHWEGDITLAEWQQVKNSGRVFGFTKATQGVSASLNDATLANNMTRARSAGLFMGCYHFADPATNTAVAEANHFVAMAAPYITPGYFRPVLDLESGGVATTAGKTYLSNWVNDWMNAVRQQTGVEPMIYTSTNYATSYLNSTVASRTLWVANWPTTPDPQNGNPGTGVWSTWAFWQYSDAVSVPGIGSTDVDVFHYTTTELQTYVIPSIICSPTTLAPSTAQGHTPASQSFTIRDGTISALAYAISSDAAWLTPTPVSGVSTGETDTITVNYAASGLPLGTYTGHLTITNGTSWYTPVTITVTLTVASTPGDLNADGRVNDLDVEIFNDCLTGAHIGPPASGCEDADIDGDNDVDMSDFARLQRCLNGILPPVANCAN